MSGDPCIGVSVMILILAVLCRDLIGHSPVFCMLILMNLFRIGKGVIYDVRMVY